MGNKYTLYIPLSKIFSSLLGVERILIGRAEKKPSVVRQNKQKAG
jgi:hypothetical protein